MVKISPLAGEEEKLCPIRNLGYETVIWELATPNFVQIFLGDAKRIQKGYHKIPQLCGGEGGSASISNQELTHTFDDRTVI